MKLDFAPYPLLLWGKEMLPGMLWPGAEFCPLVRTVSSETLLTKWVSDMPRGGGMPPYPCTSRVPHFDQEAM